MIFSRVSLSVAYLLVLCDVLTSVEARSNNDLFSFENSDVVENGKKSYGQENWDKVTCKDLDVCTGYQEKFESSIGFTVAGSNNCQDCAAEGGGRCGLHRQSPIDLKRDRGVLGGRNEKECPDWHWMSYKDGTCRWNDMQPGFSIERHALKIQTPILNNGDVACANSRGDRLYPKLDYSKGFPDWWLLDHTSITVPSHHTQEGEQYDAEVTLAHFYEIEHSKNQLGYVSIFLDADSDAPSWPYLDKLICQWRKEEEKVRSDCGLAPAPAYGRCRTNRNQASAASTLTTQSTSSRQTTEAETPSSSSQTTGAETPSSSSQTTGVETPSSLSQTTGAGTPSNFESGKDSAVLENDGNPPPTIDCKEYEGNVTFSRMCKSGSCCDSTRSDSDYCWDVYENIFPGKAINSACYYCCNPEPKIVGPTFSDVYNLQEKTIKCSGVPNVRKICKPNSCCSNPRSNSAHCRYVYDTYSADTLREICTHCCTVPQGIAISGTRSLRGGNSSLEINAADEADGDDIPEGARVVYVGGSKRLVRKENYQPDEEDDEEYFSRIYKEYKHRSLQDSGHRPDYDDVHYWPYEWLLKVETEYYFRYEGTQVIPPCWETIHWRVLKDPIRVHPRQIQELNRLLAWRRSPSGANKCDLDTAGRVQRGGDTVELNRFIQSNHDLHRMVFCECKDWGSKFQADRDWCRGYNNDNSYSRFYDTPYNFNTGGKW